MLFNLINQKEKKEVKNDSEFDSPITEFQLVFGTTKLIQCQNLPPKNQILT